MNNLKAIINEKFNEKPRPMSRFGTISGYCSVSKFLNTLLDSSGLKRWAEQVGQVTADKITKQAANRGTSMHKTVEDYIQGFIADEKNEHFIKIKPFIDENMLIKQNLVEQPLFSEKYELTGIADTIGYYNHQLSVIDYKTSRKPKERKYLGRYFLQVKLYAIMIEEMTGISVKQGVLLNAPDNEDDGLFYNAGQEIIISSDELKMMDEPIAEMIKSYNAGETECWDFKTIANELFICYNNDKLFKIGVL